MPATSGGTRPSRTALGSSAKFASKAGRLSWPEILVIQAPQRLATRYPPEGWPESCLLMKQDEKLDPDALRVGAFYKLVIAVSLGNREEERAARAELRALGVSVRITRGPRGVEGNGGRP